MDLDSRLKKIPKKSSKQMNDPIIQKKVKLNTTEPVNQKTIDPIESEKVKKVKNELKEKNKDDSYTTFLATFQTKSNKEEKKTVKSDYHNYVSSLLKTNTKTIKTTFPAFKFNTNSLRDSRLYEHYDFSWETLRKSYLLELNLKEKKNDSSNSLKNDNYSFEWDNQHENNAKKLFKEEATLNNNVQIKNYKMKQFEKTNNTFYRNEEDGSLWIMNQYSQKSIQNDTNNEYFACPDYKKFNMHNSNIDNYTSKLIASVMSSYNDIIYTDPDEVSCLEYRRLYCLHLVNHILRCQDKSKTTKNKMIIDISNEDIIESNPSDDDNDEEEEKNIPIRNKGFTKPRILILSAYKGDAFEILQTIKEIYTGKVFTTKGKKNKKFMEDFGNDENVMDDDFRIGVKLENSNVYVYTPFEESDIIISSILGLRSIVGAKGDAEREYSFLSSIEICVMDRIHIFLLQNWQHIIEIMEVMNIIPRHKDVKNDINQIREYFFENMAKFYRQNIVYTNFRFPELNSLINNYFSNYDGLIWNKSYYDSLIPNEELPINQEFMKFDVIDHNDEPKSRFDYFVNKVWEKVREMKNLEKTVIFTSSYFEFVRLRGYFKRVNANITFISEYSNKSKVQSRVAKFIAGEYKFLLTTERSFYFGVCKIKNFSNIIFYSLPQFAVTYKELIYNIDEIFKAYSVKRGNFLHDRKKMIKIIIKIIFCQFDALALERIVGSEKAQEFIANYNQNCTFLL